MKRLIITTVLALLISSSTFATNEENDRAVIKQVNEQFANAYDIEVSVKKDFTKVSFTLNARRMDAFYDHQSQFIGTAHAINISDLPIGAKRSFAKKYSGFTVTEAIKFDGIEEVAYFISGKNGDQQLILKVSAEGLMSVYKRN